MTTKVTIDSRDKKVCIVITDFGTQFDEETKYFLTDDERVFYIKDDETLMVYEDA